MRARRLRSRVRMGAAWLVVGALALTGVAPARQAFDQRRQVEQARTELEALQERNAELTDRLNRLSDVAYMEKLAREQLGVVRPGDTAYVVTPQSDQAPASYVETPPEERGLKHRVAEWIKDALNNE